MDNKELEKIVKDLKREVEQLKQKRVGQTDLIPDSVKMRHVGEGIRFVRSVVEDLPTPETPLQGLPIVYTTIDNKLHIYNNTDDTWYSIQLV